MPEMDSLPLALWATPDPEAEALEHARLMMNGVIDDQSGVLSLNCVCAGAKLKVSPLSSPP